MKISKILVCILLIQILSLTLVLGQEIFQAVQGKNIEAVKSLLRKNPDLVKEKNQDGMTPLHIAVAYGFTDIVKLLIDNNSDVNAKDNLGNLPLHYNAYSGNRAVAELLVNNGAEVNVRNKSGESPLLRAVSFGRKDLAEFLLEKGADINVKGKEGSQMLQKAVENGIDKVINILLEEGVSIEAESEEGVVLLHGAAQCAHMKLVDHLIKAGADIHSLNKKGGTLLHSAATGGLKELIEILVNKGFDVNARDSFSLTPLHKAALNGKKEAVSLLLEKGTNIDAKSNDGTTPYLLAKEENRQEIVELLISKGADVSKKRFPQITGDYLGQTPAGMTPEIFAPGIVSKEYLQDFAGTFSPDGNEFFFTRRKNVRDQRNWYMKRENGVWIKPQLAPFSYDVFEFEPHISPDGKTLFYGSRRPKPGGSQLNNLSEIWYVEKTRTGWGKPRYLTSVINDLMPMYMSAALDGTLYFTSNKNRGIYKSELIKGEYKTPERLPDEINYLFSAHPYIAPDESYLIFDARPRDNLEKDSDIYISFRNDDGSWTKADKLGDQISTNDNEIAASVSPDGKYLFFESDRAGSMNIYWINAKIIDKYRPKKDEKITVDEVVAKYLSAIGGRKAVKKINTKTVRYRVHMFGRDGYVMERCWKRPNSMRTGSPDTPIYTETEGEKSWRVSPDGRHELPALVAANFAKQADIDGPLVDSVEKGISLEYVGTEQYDMTVLYRLKITFKDGVEWEYFIDSRTGLLRKMKQPSFFILNNKISRGPDAWYYYFDYRSVGNIKFPHLWLQVTDDHTHAFVVEEIIINE